MDAKTKIHSLTILVAICVWVCQRVEAQDSHEIQKNAFLGHSKIALFEIKNSVVIREGSPNNAKEYELTITIKKVLPEVVTGGEIKLKLKRTLFGHLDPKQDPFPYEKDTTFVAAFDEDTLTSPEQFQLLQSFLGPKVRWEDCESFFKVVSAKKISEAFGLILQTQGKELTGTFFWLASYYDPKILEDEKAADMFATYLASVDVPVDSRIAVIMNYLTVSPPSTDPAVRADFARIGYVTSSFGLPKDVASRKKLGNAVIKCVLNAAHEKKSVDRLVNQFFNLFVAQGPVPDIDAKTKAELRAISKDKERLADPQVRQKLSAWLDTLVLTTGS